jgi:A/G-specific adenine glycosylase
MKNDVRSEKMERFLSILSNWGEKNCRVFPWRQTRDPYVILVAEIMLQRTRAEQVLPVFNSFIKKYPDPRALSASSIENIKSSIISLGLEKRAKGLKIMAGQIVSRYSGKVPENEKDLLSLYGVGNYIANAVLCHAYGHRVPTVDANFARVVKRVFSLKAKDPLQKDRNIWSFARRVLSHAGSNFRLVNLAIIDLASLICTPRDPKCPECPLNMICDYNQKEEKRMHKNQ